MTKTKPHLLILSDLWGQGSTDWLDAYWKPLEDHFLIEFVDSADLGGVDKTIYNQQALHEQFVNGGIDFASEQILNREQTPDLILGFSVGGVIGWRYARQLPASVALYALSATRLRLEMTKPSGSIHLFYGELDAYIPPKDWFVQMGLEASQEPAGEHSFYQDEAFAQKLVRQIIRENT